MIKYASSNCPGWYCVEWEENGRDGWIRAEYLVRPGEDVKVVKPSRKKPYRDQCSQIGAEFSTNASKYLGPKDDPEFFASEGTRACMGAASKDGQKGIDCMEEALTHTASAMKHMTQQQISKWGFVSWLNFAYGSCMRRK